MDRLSEVLNTFISIGNVDELKVPELAGRRYLGQRKNGHCEVWVEERCPNPTSREQVTIRRRKLPKRWDLWNHSPTGFEWGYGGSGPAQLALAILADSLGNDDKAICFHQRFKWEFVSRFEDQWQLSLKHIQDFISGQERGAGLRLVK